MCPGYLHVCTESVVTPHRTADRISDVPRTPVGSLRRALKPTINITDIASAGTDRNLYFAPSQFGANPCDPFDHLSRHLGGGRRRPGELITASGATSRLCSHYTAGRERDREPGPVLGAGRPIVIQGAFVFSSARRSAYGRPRRSPEDDDDVYLRLETTSAAPL